MKNNIKKILLLILFINTICCMNITASEQKADETIEYINNIRRNMNIRLIEYNNQLGSAALNHSKYMSINKSFSLVEESRNKYYRGRYSLDRASYYSYFNPYITEFISNSFDSYKEGVIDLINNPYSRISFLDPLYQHIGMGTYDKSYTYTLGGKARNTNKKIIIYPYNKMLDVPVSWKNNYMIDPYRNIYGSYNDVGLPITLSYYSDNNKIKNIYYNSIEIINKDKGSKVNTKVILPQDDKYLENSLIILPLKKLDYNTNYEVKIDVSFTFQNSKLNKENNKYKIDFRTEQKDRLINRAEFTEYFIKALDIKLLQPKKVFKDVDTKSYYAKYIYTAYSKNLVSGFNGNYFKPQDNITKEQVYTLLIRAYEKEKKEIKLNNYRPYSYSYYNVSSWAVNYIRKAEKLGLLDTVKSNELKEQITDAECKKIIKRFKQIY